MTDTPRLIRLVVVNGGLSDPSATKMLVDRVAGRVASLAQDRGLQVRIDLIGLRDLASEIAGATVSGLLGPKLTDAVRLLGEATGIVAGTPVYKAGPSGLFTSFFQLLDNDLLIAKPVVLAATAGTARHALVIDESMRSQFAYLRTLTAPTSLFAASDDWSDPSLGTRIDRAAVELVLLMESDFARQVKDVTWGSYQHEFGSAGGAELSINLDSDLMRLATGRPAIGSSALDADAT